MNNSLVIVGSSSHVLSEFKPTLLYTDYFICDRNPKAKAWMKSRVKQINYELKDEKSNDKIIRALKTINSDINIIYSAYDGNCSNSMTSTEQQASLNANCRMPIELFNMISEEFTERNVNGIFISSIYAGVAPNKDNYKSKETQNPLIYGVAKAGVEQGLRWLSCQNKKHRFNCIRLGPMPKSIVKETDPDLIENLRKKLPSGEMVGKNELNATLNYMLKPCLTSLRGSTIQLDGGYSIW